MMPSGTSVVAASRRASLLGNRASGRRERSGQAATRSSRQMSLKMSLLTTTSTGSWNCFGHHILDDREKPRDEVHHRIAQAHVLGGGEAQELAQSLLDDCLAAGTGAGRVDEALDRLDHGENVLPHGEERLLVGVRLVAIGIDAGDPLIRQRERRRRVGRVEPEVGENRAPRRVARERFLDPTEVVGDPPDRPAARGFASRGGSYAASIVGRSLRQGRRVAGSSTTACSEKIAGASAPSGCACSSWRTIRRPWRPLEAHDARCCCRTAPGACARPCRAARRGASPPAGSPRS